MGIHGIAQPPRPEPKATCPRCRRPVAVLKTGKCSYCQAEIPGSAVQTQVKAALPPELLLAFEPRAVTVSTRSKWIRRAIALGVAALLVAGVMALCMKS